MKDFFLPFSKKSDRGITKNYTGITLSAIDVIIPFFSVVFNLKLRKFIGKIRIGFGEIYNFTDSDNLSNHQTVLFIDFCKTFYTIERGKMEQVLLVYGLPKENVTAIMILYKNITAMVCSANGDTDFFDIVVGVLQQ